MSAIRVVAPDVTITPMLVIREEQMRMLAFASRERFIARLTAAFEALWLQQVHGLGEEWIDFLESSIDRAMAYGIQYESDVARFINLYFVWGAAFEEQPQHRWALNILENSALNGDEKIAELVNRTAFKLEVIRLNQDRTR